MMQRPTRPKRSVAVAVNVASSQSSMRGTLMPRMLEQLDQHSPAQATATLNLTNDMFLRSFNWVR